MIKVRHSNSSGQSRAFVLCLLLLWSIQGWARENSEIVPVSHLPAVKMVGADKAMLLAVDHAGARIVAVGDHGIVLLSDDNGKSFRQAELVPTRATLTSVSFIDSKQGWAAGHWGVILHTVDGGNTWTMLRDEISADRPLFSIYFKDSLNGFASGLWSLLLSTKDGGKTWTTIELPSSDGRKADKNLFGIFPGQGDDLFIVAERGSIFRTNDFGKNWTELRSGSAGSFWTGLYLKNDILLVAGLRGKIFRSTDNGSSWIQIESGTKSSITNMVELSNGTIVAVGLDGVELKSTDNGLTFISSVRQDQLANTAVVNKGSGEGQIFTILGVDIAKIK